MTVLLCALSFKAYAADQAERTPLQTLDQGSPSIGNPNAPVTIVEFTDFECPFCEMVQPAIRQIRESYPDQVRLVFKNFPLSFHQNARRAHLAAMCADEQGKFWEYRNHLFENQRALKRDDLLRYAKEFGLSMEPFERCLDEETHAPKIEDDFKEGVNFGIHGTPAFLINNRLLSGAQPYAVFEQLIEEELRKTA